MLRVLAAFLVCCGAATGVAAQALPSEPATFGNGRVVVGGDASVSLAPQDLGFFNYSDYEHSTLRELRLALRAQVRATERISVLGEIRSENLNHVTPFALYARIRPFEGRRLDVQIGRIPPTFGSVTRQTYGRDNPLIGSPLAYQYLTSLRADAVPANPDELLRMRGRGWLSNFTVGNLTPARGVPLVTAFSWDTGIQVSTGWKMLAVAGAVTNGTASNPRVSDDNAGKQLAMRVAVTPSAGLIIGTSFAHGDFFSRGVRSDVRADDNRTFAQRAHGLDLEYSRDHWMLRADAVLSEWQVPMPSAGDPVKLRAVAASVEGRYTFLPGAYAAARAEHLGFNRITGTSQRLPWDAPVSRLEVGAGYYLQRNLVGRVSVQFNDRDAGRITSSRLVAGQLLFWF